MTGPARCLLPILLLLASHGAYADPAPEERFAEAQALFDAAQKTLEGSGADPVETRRQFHAAATQFAALADDGVASVNLYINAGNACHFAGDDPRALLWYLRAARLANTPETRAGLASLRRTCKADPWPAEHASVARLCMFWHYDLSQHTKQILLLTLYPAGCLLVLVRLLISPRPIWLRLGVALMIIGGAVGISDVATTVAPDAPWAVVVESAKGHAGDGEGYSIVADSIAAGQEVKLIETRRDWVRIELPSQVRCWVPAEACEQV